MGVTFRQTSMIGGEIAPSLQGRVDISRYHEALSKCRNFFVQYHGGVSNRPGFRFINQVGDETKAVRLIPFEYSTEQTYVLEFGHRYMRVYMDGGVVLDADTGLPYQIQSPFTADQLPMVKFTQSADVMTLVHPDWIPRNLSRIAHDDWVMELTSFAPSIDRPTGLVVSSNSAGSIQYRYRVTAVVDDESAEESLPIGASTTSDDLELAGNKITLTWDAHPDAGSYNIYKDDNGLFGYIGTTQGTTFVDDYILPDVADTPPSSRNPFQGEGNYPSTVSYYQQRLVFAATRNRPQTLFTSKSAAYTNFTYSSPYRDDDAVTFTIASRQVNEIRHMIPLQQLILLTSGGEWVVRGDNNDLLTPTSVNVKSQGYRGSSHLPPIMVGNSALYVQSRGSAVRTLQYSIQVDGFDGNDLTVFVPHLVQGHQIVDWAWSESPHYLLFAVRDDGVLLVLTYLPEQEVWGWSQHDTDGAFESVASVSEGDEDVCYAVVRREINGATRRYIERLDTRLFGDDVRDAFFVDSGLTYDGRTDLVTNRLMVAGSYNYQDTAYITSHVPDVFDSSDIGITIVMTSDEGDTARFLVTDLVSPAQLEVTCLQDVPPSLQMKSTYLWSRAVDSLFGLHHLEGKTVSILADGNVEPQQVVTNGGITLQRPASVVHVGLPYTSEVQTLDIETMDGGTIRDRRKLINEVSLLVDKSRGIFIGEGEQDEGYVPMSSLTEYKQRTDEDMGEPTRLYSGVLRMNIQAGWNRGGRVRVVQRDPLPVSILSILPVVTAGGPAR